jgi:hypothetical protein
MRFYTCVTDYAVRAARGLSAVLLIGLVASSARGEWIPTNTGVGADAEVRESSPTSNRGSSTEIASRVRNNFIAGNPDDANDRNSAIYTKFDLNGIDSPTPLTTAFRMTYRNNNLNESRIQDSVTPNPAVRTGLAVYGLTNDSLSNWDESTITYLNAPGITLDGDVGTKDFNSDLTLLGTVSFPEIGSQNHLPIGGQIVFASANLDQFVANALAGGATTVTLVSTVIHGGDAPFGNWLNFNYLFNPKEQTTLNSDNYDADINDPNNPIGGPVSADNSTGLFSPSLLIIPEPTTAALSLFAMLGVVGRRRARR